MFWSIITTFRIGFAACPVVRAEPVADKRKRMSAELRSAAMALGERASFNVWLE
jgi:hypothetical protein